MTTADPDVGPAPWPATGGSHEPESDEAPGQPAESGADAHAAPTPAPASTAEFAPDTIASHTARPLPVSGGLSVLAGLMAVLFVATGSGQVVALGIALGSAVVLAVGVAATQRGHWVVGLALWTAAVLGVAAALAWGVTETAAVEQRVEILPALLGLPVLAAGVTAAVRGYERLLVVAGTGLILTTIVISGLVEDAPIWAMLAGTAATYVAWDVGEQAINLGEQVGRQARRTWRPELVHGGAGGVVGGVGVVVGLGIAMLGVSGLPLLGLTTLLVAAVVLAAALST